MADALVAAGHARDRQDAFDRYLADGGPATVPHQGLEPEEAIRLVTDSGGAAVLAHPASLRMDAARRWRRSCAACATGASRGIEVHRPDHTPERRGTLAELARRAGLVPCGGSDFHRPEEPLRPGDTGDPPLPAGRHRPPAPTPRASRPVGPRVPSASVDA